MMLRSAHQLTWKHGDMYVLVTMCVMSYRHTGTYLAHLVCLDGVAVTISAALAHHDKAGGDVM